MLNIIDQQWKDHLLGIDHLKQGIGLVGYGQKDPLVEYKKQSFDMFQAMLDRTDENMIRSLFNLEIVVKDEEEELRQLQQMEQQRARKQWHLLPVTKEQVWLAKKPENLLRLSEAHQNLSQTTYVIVVQARNLRNATVLDNIK
jgi:preprotein translocase subunit SecA